MAGPVIGALDPAALWGFVLAATLMEITPGPNMAYLAILSLSDGRRAGYAVVAASPLAYQSLR
ncbi:hypothetical protein FNJ84_12285 [Paracoccus sp. M683]|uniref:hypothetical protein n=1 Tax=Paracoccus sp. M683 TaxID=2594268 RepID=UPI00117FBCBF|nr:hypothetical protein [Paracoccus sp. M683]TRW96833.1 hypothetical protein FNJ84_12285 [Paracoccus sp. M683]